MELKLVYRILRGISLWTVNGFYSDVEVLKEDFPKEDPVIIACTHHNEIIDIATLSITIPFGRHVSFWAKSTMFANPLVGAILSSSGAIPVKRNLNATSSATPTTTTTANSLFASTSEALSRSQVIGVFPEGTSYTQPKILQIMSGAAWAGVEYMRAKKKNERDAVIVPVAIVYTDKGKYQSRVRVQFGTPIPLEAYKEQLLTADDEDTRAVVKEIMANVEMQMYDMTVNAPDWETLYAAQIARDILFPNDDIPLKDWVKVNQRLVDAFCKSDSRTQDTKTSLTKYFSLLHHTELSHTNFTPSIKPSSIFRLLPTILLLPLHFPSFIFAHIGAKYLATPGEEEGEAEYKGVGGGIGLALWWFGLWTSGVAGNVLRWATGQKSSFLTWAFVCYTSIKIYNYFISQNWKTYLHLRARVILLLSRLFPNSLSLPEDELEAYTRLPPPPTNAFIRKREAAAEEAGPKPKPPPPRIPAWRLIRHLLVQRSESVRMVQELGLNREDLLR